ncbi:hypothetical protein [Streptomyces sp. NPDC093970]|uniref:hypothetical protein n=1 Tax=Streptomyces sp. NPDC093970 TaxID=3155076 RepID=UPI00341B88BD
MNRGRLQRLQSPTRWRAAHELLAETFRSWRSQREEVLPSAERWSDPASREHRYNETDHRMCADPRRALPDALADTVHACGHGSATARRWTQLLAQAGTDTEDDGLQAWAERLTVASRHDTAAVLAILDTLLAHAGTGTTGQLRARIVRGHMHRRAKRNEAALADLTAALALDPQHHDALVGRAYTHQQMGNATAALADTDEAIRVTPDAWTHVLRGHINLTAGHRAAALTDFRPCPRTRPQAGVGPGQPGRGLPHPGTLRGRAGIPGPRARHRPRIHPGPRDALPNGVREETVVTRC